MTAGATARERVWVVDDRILDASRAQSALNASYQVRTFSDGASVLDALAREAPPDVLVLDWLMPDVSGLEVVQYLRASPRLVLQELKVLLLTSQDQPGQVVEGLDAGADDYLSKPYERVELRARVGALARSKRLSDRVRAAERTIRELLTHAPDALVAVDERGHITWVNLEAEKLVGEPCAELVERNLQEVLPDLEWQRLRDGAPVRDVRHQDRIYHASLRAIEDASMSGMVFALRDVTEKRRTEERRLDFYSMMAHDLRSPLHNMLLRTQLLARGRFGEFDAPVVLELERVIDAMRQMVSLIDDFLEIASLESIASSLSREPVDLGGMVRDLEQEYGPSVRSQRVDLTLDVPPERVRVPGDPRRLRQAVVNLLTNAIKFTAAGGRVEMAVWPEGREACLAVRDTGRGIPSDVQKRLFQRYSRYRRERDDVRGTGLGLMIVREIVEAHGGRIEVSSEVGRGSEFLVRLPSA